MPVSLLQPEKPEKTAKSGPGTQGSILGCFSLLPQDSGFVMPRRPILFILRTDLIYTKVKILMEATFGIEGKK